MRGGSTPPGAISGLEGKPNPHGCVCQTCHRCRNARTVPTPVPPRAVAEAGDVATRVVLRQDGDGSLDPVMESNDDGRKHPHKEGDEQDEASARTPFTPPSLHTSGGFSASCIRKASQTTSGTAKNQAPAKSPSVRLTLDVARAKASTKTMKLTSAMQKRAIAPAPRIRPMNLRGVIGAQVCFARVEVARRRRGGSVRASNRKPSPGRVPRIALPPEKRPMAGIPLRRSASCWIGAVLGRGASAPTSRTIAATLRACSASSSRWRNLDARIFSRRPRAARCPCRRAAAPCTRHADADDASSPSGSVAGCGELERVELFRRAAGLSG